MFNNTKMYNNMKYNNMVYSDNIGKVRVREGLGKWFKDYSKENFNEDWKYCLGLSYKYYMKNTGWRKNLKSLYKDLSMKDSNINGFVVNELDTSMTKLHHHLIIKSDLGIIDFKKIVETNWSKRGLIDLMEYDSSKDYCFYISKHYNKTDSNIFEMLDSFK